MPGAKQSLRNDKPQSDLPQPVTRTNSKPNARVVKWAKSIPDFSTAMVEAAPTEQLSDPGDELVIPHKPPTAAETEDSDVIPSEIGVSTSTHIRSETSTTYSAQSGKVFDVELYRKTLELQMETLGPEHRTTLRTMGRLGNELQKLGGDHRPEAEQLLRMVFETQTRVLGKEDEDPVWTIDRLAECLMALKCYDEAEATILHVMYLKRSVYEESDVRVLTATLQLSKLYFKYQKRYEDALALNKERLETTRKVLGADHHETLRSMANVADCFGCLKRLEEAIKLRKELMSIYTRLRGSRHKLTLTAMHNLVNDLDDNKEYKEAEKLIRKVVNIRTKDSGLEERHTPRKHGSAGTRAQSLGKGKRRRESATDSSGATIKGSGTGAPLYPD